MKLQKLLDQYLPLRQAASDVQNERNAKKQEIVTLFDGRTQAGNDLEGAIKDAIENRYGKYRESEVSELKSLRSDYQQIQSRVDDALAKAEPVLKELQSEIRARGGELQSAGHKRVQEITAEIEAALRPFYIYNTPPTNEIANNCDAIRAVVKETHTDWKMPNRVENQAEAILKVWSKYCKS